VTGALAAGCGVIGLLVGAFLNVVIWRVPRDESVVRPRSRCPGCGTQLGGADNIPVLSWLVLRGRCRSCQAPISARYPLVELLTGALFAGAGARFAEHDTAALPAFLAFFAGLVALSFIDLDHHRLPIKVVYPTLFATAAGLVVAAAATGEWANLARAAAGGVIAFLALYAVRIASPGGMAFGDVRLAGVIGTALGWLSLAHVGLGLFLAFLTSAVIGVALIVSKRKSRKDKIPFGPFLAAGAVLATFFGEPVIRWYGL
jgi:leader peptidase (prepilin peptidase)/N-methyltransferase